MQRLVINSFLILVLSFSFATEARAQSNFDLDPPMQADTNSQQVYMSTDPSALPVFKFATAEISDGKVVVSTTKAEQKLLAPMPGGSALSPELDPKGIAYTENVTQSYTVAVPYTEMVSGKAVTRTRMETRTRTVPVARYRARNAEEQAEHEKAVEEKKKEDAEKGVEKPEIEPATVEMVQQTYAVSVPYTEMVDGVPTTRTRTETRTRTMQVTRGKTETKGKTVSSSYKIEEIKAYTVAGKELDQDAIKDRIAERAPVIVINSKKAISPYFEAILKPGTLFLVCPEKVEP